MFVPLGLKLITSNVVMKISLGKFFKTWRVWIADESTMKGVTLGVYLSCIRKSMQEAQEVVIISSMGLSLFFPCSTIGSDTVGVSFRLSPRC